MALARSKPAILGNRGQHVNHYTTKAAANRKEGEGLGVVPSRGTGCGGHGGHGFICKGDTALFWNEEGEPWDGRDQTIVFQLAVSSPLSLCRRGFQDLLKVRPSSLLMLCGCISSSIAFLNSQLMYSV
jgi:hypothetical protein